MKTLADLEELKTKQMQPFPNAYVYLIRDIQNDLISKSDGMERAKSKLSVWNKDAKEEIKAAVLEEFEGMYDFVFNNSDMLIEFSNI